MNYKNNLLFLFMALCALLNKTTAQDGIYYTVSDLELWSSASLKYKYNDDWSFNLENQFRLKSNATVMDQNLIQIGAKREFGDQFSTAVSYRYILSNDNKGDVQGLEHYNRLNLDLAYRLDVKRFTFSTRARYQTKKEYGTDDGSYNTIRLKVGSEYNIKKWKLDPKFSAEIFNGLTDRDGFTKYRITFGTEYKIKKLGEISAFYRIEQELVGAYPSTNYIVGLGFQYTIKNK